MEVKDIEANLKGTITEFKVLTYFMEHGYYVSVPQSPCRYDFILDYNNKLYRIQTKTSSVIDGNSIKISTSSSRPNGKAKHKHISYKEDNIDFFCTIFENECYLIPVNACGKDMCRLHLLPPQNGQIKNIRFAKDFQALKILNTLNK